MNMNTPDNVTLPAGTQSNAPVAKTAAAKPVVAKAAVAAKPAVAKAATATKPPVPKTTKPAVKAVAVKAVAKTPVKTVKPAAKSVAAATPKVRVESKPVKIAAEPKAKKAKLVRDSFTMPEVEYQVLGDMKKAALKAGFDVKKSELLRVGVALIQKLDIAKLKQLVASLSPLKAGRPKNDK
jgi:hypothetical protein